MYCLNILLYYAKIEETISLIYNILMKKFYLFIYNYLFIYL